MDRMLDSQAAVALKPKIPVTLVCVDTTNKVAFSERAILKCLEQADFAYVKLLTTDTSRKFAVKIPNLDGLEAYSDFVTRKLHRYVNTSHVLICQADGYVLNGEGWSPAFLQYDYLGAPFQQSRTVGNGGFSLRSKRLLEATAKLNPKESSHPEDAWISFKHRKNLETLFGIQFADFGVASRFAFEGRSFNAGVWNGMDLAWKGQFGFHSWLSVLPGEIDRPSCFHHSGDAGDVIYSLATIKALGGGVLFLSPDNKHPWPKHTRWTQSGGHPDWVGNLSGLCKQQDYIWGTYYTHQTPPSTDFDLNKFREFYRMPRKELWDSLFQLHLKTFGISYPENEPWLQLSEVRKVPGRDIVINRTERFTNPDFPWKDLVRLYGQRMVFVGTPQEHAQFAQFGTIPRADTKNLLEVAQYVGGARLCIMNQSCPLAIAHGLGKKVVVCEWPGNANCHLNRPGAVYYLKGNLVIPDDWL